MYKFKYKGPLSEKEVEEHLKRIEMKPKHYHELDPVSKKWKKIF